MFTREEETKQSVLARTRLIDGLLLSREPPVWPLDVKARYADGAESQAVSPTSRSLRPHARDGVVEQGVLVFVHATIYGHVQPGAVGVEERVGVIPPTANKAARPP